MTEIWKPCLVNSNYLVSSWGRVYSKKSKHLLRPQIDKSRANYYMRVKINGKSYYLHRLIAGAFLGDNPDLQVDHKDRNTLNNSLSNLRWVTESQNKLHMHETSKTVYDGVTLNLSFKEKKFGRSMENN